MALELSIKDLTVKEYLTISTVLMRLAESMGMPHIGVKIAEDGISKIDDILQAVAEEEGDEIAEATRARHQPLIDEARDLLNKTRNAAVA